jgi:hypothetical protein
VKEVLSHPFFKDRIDIEALLKKQLKAEFIPTVDSTGVNNFEAAIVNEKPEESMIPADAM